jgi:hypothetical protein
MNNRLIILAITLIELCFQNCINKSRQLSLSQMHCDSIPNYNVTSEPFNTEKYLCYLYQKKGTRIGINEYPKDWISKDEAKKLLYFVNDTTSCSRTNNPMFMLEGNDKNPISTIREEVVKLMQVYLVNTSQKSAKEDEDVIAKLKKAVN